jgi:membrane fusion protein (multidrug efflux system)
MDTLIDDLIESRPATKPAARTRVDAEPAATRVRVPSRKATLRALVVGGLVVLIGVGVGLYLRFAGQVSTDDAQVDAHIAPIAAKVSGSVAEILVSDNQSVKAGQVLLRIDPATTRRGWRRRARRSPLPKARPRAPGPAYR